MIQFDIRKYKHDTDSCYIKYNEIEYLTEQILKDYDSRLLSDPIGIDYEDFLINYLNADVKFEHIYPESENEIILGCTAFNKMKLDIYDEQKCCHSQIKLVPRDIVLDRSIIDGNGNFSDMRIYDNNHNLIFELAYHPEKTLDKSRKPILHYHLYDNNFNRTNPIKANKGMRKHFKKYLKGI